MAASKKPTSTSADKKIFDVTKPGKSAPTASSKPIIITNRPILKDPMVVDKSGQDTTTATVLAPSRPSTKVKISPLDEALQEVLKAPTHTDEEETPIESPEAGTPTTVAEASVGPETATTPEITPDEPTNKAAEPAPEVTTEPDRTAAEPAAEKPAEDTAEPGQAEQVPTPNEPAAPAEASTDNATAPTEGDAQKAPSKADEEAARKEAERHAELQKLIDSRKFYLPIDRKGKRRTKWHVILGTIIILLLAVVWVDVALDSGMIHIAGVKPYTHFFSK